MSPVCQPGLLHFYTMNNGQKRRYRLRLARIAGTHTSKEWEDMKKFFEYTCCRCGGESGLINVEKDHIIPLYHEGFSSDSIGNLQPLCALCNLQKGGEHIDYRPSLARKLSKTLPIAYQLVDNAERKELFFP